MQPPVASRFNRALKFVRQFTAERLITNTHKFITDRQPLVWLLALVLGVVVGAAAIGFRLLISAIQWPWLGTTTENVATAASHLPWYVIILAPAVGGLFVGLVLARFFPGKRGPSVADVIESTSVKGCRIDPKTGVMSIGLAAVSLGTGASVGREGPVVHFGATIAALTLDVFKLPPSAQRTLIASGVAAAISASFNAPIAGVVFAHEVILRHYAIRAIVPVVISSVIAGVISRTYFGNYPAFNLPDYQITSTWEFPAFALLGITCALVAIIFQATLMVTEHLTWRVSMPIWVRTTLAGFFVGTVGVAFPHVLGLGYDTTDQALSQQLPLWLLITLIFAKTATTAVSLASRLVGGVFSPALYLGAMTGGAFGIIAASVFPTAASSNGLYAILGMGAVAGAVLGAPLSTVLIIFELTGGYTMTIALLLTVSVAVGLNHAVLGRSYFHWQLEKRGLFLHDGPHQSVLRSLTVSDFMKPITAEADDEADPNIEGTPREPKTADDGEAVLLANDFLATALRTFDDAGSARIAVIASNNDRTIIAWAEKIAALNAYNSALIDAHIEAHR